MNQVIHRTSGTFIPHYMRVRPNGPRPNPVAFEPRAIGPGGVALNNEQNPGPPPRSSSRRDDENDSELTLNFDGSVQAGTLPALIRRLTLHSRVDEQFEETFMMTFKTFATVDQVVDRLVERFYIQPPAHLGPKQLQEWKTNKETPIRLRVIDATRKVVNALEQEDLYILDKVKQFLEQAMTCDQTEVRMATWPALQEIESYATKPRSTSCDTPFVQPISPILPPRPETSILMRLEPLELAQQLTIMESELFLSIKPSEWIAQSTGSNPPSHDNIKAVITVTNKMTDWVMSSVLSREDSRRRAETIKHFINIANECRLLSNFSSMAAILAGLNDPAILGLKRTWEQVKGSEKTVLSNIRATLDTESHFQTYRSLLSELQPPCVPFLGVYLVILNFIRDNVEDVVHEGTLINFQKRRRIADVLREINGFSKHRYSLTIAPAVQEFINESLYINKNN